MQIRFALIIVLSLFLSSCYKEEPVMLTDDSKPSGRIYYTAYGNRFDSAGQRLKRPDFQGAAYFFKTSEMNGYQAEVVGDVAIGSITIPYRSGYYYSFTHQNYLDPINPFQFGRTIQFSISGGGSYAKATVNVYAPQVIYVSSSLDSIHYVSGRKHSKKDPLTITWNPDPNNQFIQLNLFYDGIQSNCNDSGLSNRSYGNAPITIPDNGSYTIDPVYFEEFKSNSVIEIHVARAGKGIMKSNNHVIDVTADTYSYASCTITE